MTWESTKDLEAMANSNLRPSEPENMGQMHFRNCKDLDGTIIDVQEETVTGFRFVHITHLSCTHESAIGPPVYRPEYDDNPHLFENRPRR